MTSSSPFSVSDTPVIAVQGHDHDHGTGHAQGHDHDHADGRSHAHAQGHVPAPPEVPRPGRSLVRMSLGERLAIAGGVSAVIWLGVVWATRPIGG